MGMYGNWLRVTPAELKQAKSDLDWAYKHARAAMTAEDDRWMPTDKAWKLLHHLLVHRGCADWIMLGAEPFVEGDVDEFSDGSWGYGPPRYMTPEQVAQASAELAEVTELNLVAGVDPAELTRMETYQTVPPRPADLQWSAFYVPATKQFFADAASAGGAIICWIN